MEHRRNQRRRVSVAVKLVVNGKLLAITRSLEISKGGVRIVNPGVRVRRNQIVDIHFPNIKEHDKPQIKSMVIHASPAYIGLMFASNLPVEQIILPQAKRSGVGEKGLSEHGSIESGGNHLRHLC